MSEVTCETQLEAPWIKLAEICKTRQVPEKFNFVTDVLDKYAVLTPTNLALWVDNDEEVEDDQEQVAGKLTFEELKIASTKIAIAIQNLLQLQNTAASAVYSNTKNNVIFILLPKVPEWWITYLAAIRLGLIFCPGTVQLTAQDVAYRLETSNAKIIVTNQQNLQKIEEAQRINLEKQNILHNHATSAVKILVPDSDKLIAEEDGVMVRPDWLNLNDLLKNVTENDVLAFKNAETNSDDVAQVFFTSGTTGNPKMVAHTHASFGIGHYTSSRLLGLNAADIVYTLSDPGWVKSSYHCFSTWILGAAVYVHQMERFTVQKVLQVLCKRPITKFCAPPTFFTAIVQEKDLELFKFHSLQSCFTAGEPLNEEVLREWSLLTSANKNGARLIDLREIYGQTEMVPSAGYSSGEKRVEHSFGRAVLEMDLCLVDSKGTEVTEGEGQIAIKIKPQKPIRMFKGYLTEIQPNGELVFDTSNPSFVGDYYLTGDLAYRDADNYLYFVSRTDDIIISAAYRIGPFEVEDVIQAHPAVVENAVVPTPHPLRGTVVKAFIVLAEEYKSRNKQELIQEIQNYCKSQTAPYKYPRQIEFIDALPKTISGKILRRELKQKELDKSAAFCK